MTGHLRIKYNPILVLLLDELVEWQRRTSVYTVAVPHKVPM